MASGVIKRIVGDKGFGFIVPDGGNGRASELFFHRSGCDAGTGFDGLREGQRVSFEEGSGAKGPRAERVRAVD